MDDQATAGLERGIKRYEADVEAARQRKTRADQAAAADAPPDLEALEQAASQAEALANEAAAETGRLAQRLDQIEAWQAGLQKKRREPCRVGPAFRRGRVIGRDGKRAKTAWV